MESIAETVTALGVPATLVIVILKLVFDFINGRKKDRARDEKKDDPVPCLIDKDTFQAIWDARHAAMKILDMNQKCVIDGTPLIYRKTSTSEKMVETLDKLLEATNKSIFIMERVQEKLDK